MAEVPSPTSRHPPTGVTCPACGARFVGTPGQVSCEYCGAAVVVKGYTVPALGNDVFLYAMPKPAEAAEPEGGAGADAAASASAPAAQQKGGRGVVRELAEGEAKKRAMTILRGNERVLMYLYWCKLVNFRVVRWRQFTIRAWLTGLRLFRAGNDQSVRAHYWAQWCCFYRLRKGPLLSPKKAQGGQVMTEEEYGALIKSSPSTKVKRQWAENRRPGGPQRAPPRKPAPKAAEPPPPSATATPATGTLPPAPALGAPEPEPTAAPPSAPPSVAVPTAGVPAVPSVRRVESWSRNATPVDPPPATAFPTHASLPTSSHVVAYVAPVPAPYYNAPMMLHVAMPVSPRLSAAGAAHAARVLRSPPAPPIGLSPWDAAQLGRNPTTSPPRLPHGTPWMRTPNEVTASLR